jgi:uncharacterized caspase-like protein
MLSCAPGERSFEHESLRHGVFFYHVIEGLKGAAREQGNEVTWFSLGMYVRRHVPKTVKRLYGNGGNGQWPNEIARIIGESPVLAK